MQQQNFEQYNKSSDLKRDDNTLNREDPTSQDMGIGITKVDKNKIESFKAENKPMQDFWMLTGAVVQVYSINFALKFGLFEHLEKINDFASLKDILAALKISMPERRLLDWLDQLYVHGFLERAGLAEFSKYKLSDYSRKYFLLSSEDSYVYVYLQHYSILKNFENTEKLIQSGKYKDSYASLTSNEECMRVTNAFQNRANKLNFERLFDNVDFTQFKSVVDIAGRGGCLARKFAKRFPNVEYICYDDKAWKKIQTETIEKCGEFPSNIKFEYGNPLDKIPESDCIIVPEVLPWLNCKHKNTLEENLFKSLKVGGKLILIENITSEERNVDDCGLTSSFFTMMVGSEGHANSFKELSEALKKHGFKDVSLLEKGYGNCAIIFATK